MKIKEIGKVITGKTPTTKKSEYFEGDILFITPSDITNGGYIDETERHISKSGLNSIKNNSITGISILVGCIGSDMGNVAWTDKTCASNQQINAITNIRENINPLYIYYWLSQKKVYLQQLAGTTTTPILPKSNFEEIDIPIPSKNIQDSIVEVLKSLDEKIENNNAINAELESMAKTIYDYWFLQFEFPNEEGKPYKSSGGKMVWNEELKREIPENWKVKKISKIAELYQSQTISEKELIDNGSYLVYGANGIVGKYDKYNHEENEIAVCCRGASCGEYLMTLPKSWITGNSMVIHPNEDFNYKEYLYYSLSKNRIQPFITGSAQPQITRSNLGNMPQIIATKNVIENFERIASDIRKKIQIANYENQELISLRDFLLPLLMNGQVGFKE